MLADALRGLGVAPSLAPPVRTPALDAGACFSQPAGGELMVEGRKVVGSAQFRQGTALLQHGSILLQDNQGVVLSVTSGKRPVDYFPPAAEPWAQGGDIAQAISTAATLRWQGTWDRVDDQSAVLSRASSHFGHYRSVAWTWVR